MPGSFQVKYQILAYFGQKWYAVNIFYSSFSDSKRFLICPKGRRYKISNTKFGLLVLQNLPFNVLKDQVERDPKSQKGPRDLYL